MTPILINVGYFLMLSALLVRDILWLRAILIAAQSSLFSYGLVSANQPVIFWNGLFVIINIIQVIRLVRERRPIELPEKLIEIYDKVFSSMRRREFLYLWHMATERQFKDQLIVEGGKHPKEISLIISGKVEVLKDEQQMALLSKGSFIAEMSFLTGKVASADVKALGNVKLISWEQKKLHSLKQINTELFIKLQNILGKDLTEKVNPNL